MQKKGRETRKRHPQAHKQKVINIYAYTKKDELSLETLQY